MLKPKKSGTNQRLYRRKDVEMVLEIKHLLYEKRYTIEGARKFLESRARPLEVVKPAGKRQKGGKAAGFKGEPQASLFGEPGPGALAKIRQELIAIAALLK
jgi:DNA-binding transcriptional MerR regulator